MRDTIINIVLATDMVGHARLTKASTLLSATSDLCSSLQDDIMTGR